ncbi:MAG: hypothetical protein ACJA01_004076 [Saprospiraceae bacterium]|jgi:hypothetical protein
MIVVPRNTTGEVVSPVKWMRIYDTAVDAYQYYDGTSWSQVGSGGAFERVGALVRQKEGAGTDDFVIGRDSLPNNGEHTSGHFLFFHKSKTAFRGGYLQSSPNWVPDSLGFYSFAFELNAKATKISAIAMGHLTSANGFVSTAMGPSTTANGNIGPTALGRSTIVNGDDGATSMGYRTTANGNRGTVVGQ